MAVANYSPPAEALIKRRGRILTGVTLCCRCILYSTTIRSRCWPWPVQGRAALDTAHWRGCQPADG